MNNGGGGGVVGGSGREGEGACEKKKSSVTINHNPRWPSPTRPPVSGIYSNGDDAGDTMLDMGIVAVVVSRRTLKRLVRYSRPLDWRAKPETFDTLDAT